MEEEYEGFDVIETGEPIYYYEPYPWYDKVLPKIVMLTDDDDIYTETYNQTEGGFVWGLDGDDFIWTKSFDVSIYGGDGDDTIVWSYQPPALIDGGEGIDTLDMSRLPRGTEVDLAVGYADDPLFLPLRQVELRSIENVIGTDFADNIFGSHEDNVLYGGAGGDTILGRSGDDELHGGSSGAGERDVLWGGSGADRFVFKTAEENKALGQTDLVRDFEDGTDMLVFESRVPVGSVEFRGADYVPGELEILDPRQSYIMVHHGSEAGLGETTEVRLYLADGFSSEYSAITLTGHHDLTPEDFMFI